MPIRLVIADDFPLILCGIEHVLRAEPDYEILARCGDGNEALEAVRRLRPDVLILDSRMPALGSLEVIRALRRERSTTRVVLHAENSEEELVQEAVHLGVHGVVLKEMQPATLLQCMRKVHAGGTWLEWRAASQVLKDLRLREDGAREAGLLTPREQEVLLLLCRGLSNKDMAKLLAIREPTVKVHVRHLYEKLHVKGRLALIRYAEEKRLVRSIRS